MIRFDYEGNFVMDINGNVCQKGNYDIPTSAEIVKQFDVIAFLEQENQLFDEDETYGNF